MDGGWTSGAEVLETSELSCGPSLGDGTVRAGNAGTVPLPPSLAPMPHKFGMGAAKVGPLSSYTLSSNKWGPK
jgi:hypothetical protein